MLLSDEMLDLRNMIRDFVDKEIIPNVAEYDKTGEMPLPLYQKCIDIGVNAVYMPEKYGGPELSELGLCVIQEELCRGDCGIATTMGASSLASLPVILYGTDKQKDLWWNTLAKTHFAAFCLTEPNAGSDAGNVATTATEDGDSYIINGAKTFISNGGIAGIYTVFASMDRTQGTKGLAAFIVERDREGVSTGKEEDKMGMRLSNTTEVVFNEVRVPKSHLIGRPGEGFKIAMKTLDASRPGVAAQGVGLAQRAMEEAIKYSKERVQFGRPISAFQVNQFKIADMAIEIESARQMYYHAATLVDSGLPHTVESAIAKTKGSDTAMAVTVEAVQILGGYGYSREYPVEKLMRDAKILQIFEGTNEIQRTVIAGEMLRRKF